MLAAVKNAQKLDWAGWSLGIMRSFIAGGAGAFASTTTVGVVDPRDWGFGNLGHMALLFTLTFLGAGVFHLMIFLQTHPIPDSPVVAEIETKTKVN